MTAEIRAQIASALDAVTDASAKQIASAIGKADCIGAVNNALNAMRTDGDVECEREKDEWRYWLAKPLSEIVKPAQIVNVEKPITAAPKAIKPGTRREKIWKMAAPNAVSCQDIARVLGCPRSVVAPELTSLTKAGYLTREKSQDGIYLYSQAAQATAPSVTKAKARKKAGGQDSDSEGGEADIRQVEPQTFEAIERELANAKALADKLQTLLTSSRHECEALRAQLQADSTEDAKRLRETITMYSTHLDQVREYLAPISGDIDPSDLTEPELAALAAKRISEAEGDPAVDVKDAAHGYLIRAPKRRPKIVTKPETAVAAAMAAARNGSGRGEVFALVPVGTARRGATWSDAK